MARFVVIVLVVLATTTVHAQDCFADPDAVPVPITNQYACAPGFYCPNIEYGNPQTLPSLCPPSIQCQLRRLNSAYCPPQGVYEPTVCLAGSFCANFSVQETCPAGFYCITGTTVPVACGPFTNCPAGSTYGSYYGGLVSLGIIDSVLVLVYIIWKFVLPRLRLRSATNKLSILSDAFAEEGATSEDVLVRRNAASALAANFEQGRGNLRMNLSFSHMSYTLPSGKTILSDVSGEIHSGRVLAIMGASGAGKTTLLSVLMGKLKKTQGTLLINGIEEDMSHYRKIIGFVPQDDIMLRELTVRENIVFSARVRLPSWSSKVVEAHVDTVLDSLGLNQCRDTIIGDDTTRGISGGERKRTNIGIELSAVPVCIFLDEPTSGLDSTAALSICSNLRQMAQLGMTVVCVVHQPRREIFLRFDDLLLLAPGGKTVFMGPVTSVVAYFQDLGFEFPVDANPADVIMDILAGSQPDVVSEDLSVVWEHHIKRARSDTNPQQAFSVSSIPLSSHHQPIANVDELRSAQGQHLIQQRGASFFQQIVLVFSRSILQQARHLTSILLELAVGFIAGALIGFAVLFQAGQLYQGIYIAPYTLVSSAPLDFLLPQLCLLLGLALAVSGAPAGVRTFGEERVVYWREASAGHNRFSYYLGKILSVVPRFALSALHFTAIFCLLAGPLMNFGELYLVIFLFYYAVYGLASIVSFLVRRDNAPLLAVIMAMFAAVFCGYGPNLNDETFAWIMQISYARWGAEAIYTRELEPYEGVYDIDYSTSIWGYTLHRFWFDVGMMAVIGTAYRLVAFFLMLFTHRDKQ